MCCSAKLSVDKTLNKKFVIYIYFQELYLCFFFHLQQAHEEAAISISDDHLLENISLRMLITMHKT